MSAFGWTAEYPVYIWEHDRITLNIRGLVLDRYKRDLNLTGKGMMNIRTIQPSRTSTSFFHHIQRIALVVGFSILTAACGGATDPQESTTAPPPSDNRDTTAPVVSVASPFDGAVVSATVSLSANASDNVGVVSVEYILDDSVVLGKSSSAPYTFSWNSGTVSNGSHTLIAVAADAAGNLTASAAINFTVSNAVPPPVGDTQKPSVAITAPSSGAVVSGAITVSASASDNVGVTLVQFLLNGVTLLKEDASSPYSFSWDTTREANGTHTLTAFARDAAGNLASSSPISITIKNNNALLTWDANTEPDIAGYRVYFGTTSGSYQQAKGNGIVALGTSHTVTGLASGVRYYFTVTAFDTSGNESEYAVEVFKDIL